MIFDALTETLKFDFFKALYNFLPVITCLSLFYAFTYLPCYNEQRGLIILLINYVISTITLNLMLFNMTGKPFSIIQPIILLPVIPLVAYHFIGVTPEVERLLP